MDGCKQHRGCGNRGYQIAEIELELRLRDGGNDIHFQVVAIVLGVVVPEEEAVIGQMATGVGNTLLKPVADV